MKRIRKQKKHAIFTYLYSNRRITNDKNEIHTPLINVNKYFESKGQMHHKYSTASIAICWNERKATSNYRNVAIKLKKEIPR